MPKTTIEALAHTRRTCGDNVDIQRAFLAGVAFATYHLHDGAEADRIMTEVETLVGEMIETAGAA